MTIARRILRTITLTLWVIALILAIELLAGALLRIGSAADIAPLVSFHNFCVSTTQGIVLAAVLLTVVLILYALLNKNNAKRIQQSMLIHDDFISLKASTERQVNLCLQKQSQRSEELSTRLEKIEHEHIVFKEQQKHDEVIRQTHEGSILTKVTRCTLCMNRLAEHTELQHEVEGFTDESLDMLRKLKAID